MPHSPLRRFICYVLGPIIDMDDGELLRALHEGIYAPSGPWAGILEHSRPQSNPRAEAGRPAIGGTRITKDWLCSLEPRDCLYRFRLYAHEIAELAVVMDIPQPFRTQSRYVFTRVEALGLLLARFRSAGDEYELSMKYNRSQSSISEVINELSEHLDERWKHLLDFDRELLSSERMQQYANAIYAAGAPLDSVWGFIDCTIRGVCRPTWWQRIVYNGYKKIHATKYQAVKLPDGLIGHLFGPIEGRRNDNALLAASELLDKCAQFAFQPGADLNTPITQRYFQLFGDPAYGVSPLILSPFANADQTVEETAWNAAMAATRIEVEHGFGDIMRQWPFLNAWWKHRIYSSPVGRYYRVGVLLSNALNCIRPNQTSQYFDLLPPYVDEYFHD